MTPEPPRLTNNTTPENASLDSSSPAQHGNRLYDDDARSRRRSVDRRDSEFSLPGTDDGAASIVSEENELNSASLVGRISEYESATVFSTPRRVEEFGFKVVPSQRRNAANPSGVPLGTFPNEVLTHILSLLPPPDLSSMSLVNRRFHSLVTTPYAWRIAFSRYFLGPASLHVQGDKGQESEGFERILLEKRAFSRLTALASWRNEYILRTRLLRSLAKGRPAEHHPPGRLPGTTGASPPRNPNAVITYGSLLLYPVTHLDAKFGTGAEKRLPLFVHGASEQGTASISEPAVGKVGAGSWGIADPQTFNHFGDLFPFEQQWGRGQGEVVGVPNTMDVSQQYGMVYGEGCPPRGRTYFISSTEKRGRFLSTGDATPNPHLGIPNMAVIPSSACSVWISKSPRVIELTNGVCGMFSGSSLGILTAYAIGPHTSYNKRFERGEVTARWVLSPGVPIISIKVDENCSAKRRSQRRIWVVVLNALGEVFYLTDVPSQPTTSPGATADELDQAAWAAGRSVRWELIESTRRVAQPDPHSRLSVDGSYSPRSSPASMNLTGDQVAAETREIEQFLSFKPRHFKRVCQGWNMRRKLEVDFAGDDLHGAGESVVVIDCGSEEDSSASARRYLRLKQNASLPESQHESFPQIQPVASHQPSLFGGPESPAPESVYSEPLSRDSSVRTDAHSTSATAEWHSSDLIFDAQEAEITSSTMDTSTFANMTVSEDPLLAMCGHSDASSSSPSQVSSPLWHSKRPTSRADVPGLGARFLALGTSHGTVYVWNMRAAASQTPGITNQINPLRVINTDSPQISSLAMTSLYLVHGGNDGLVQAWDPLASSTLPIRTLNSRFSTRARRHLAQAQAAVQGTGNNYFGAGALCLDPDATRLRGVVALGTHLRYWSYSSSAADHYKSSKRRLRYSQRGTNSSPESQRFNSSGRGAFQEYILDEKRELEREKTAREKENARLRGRFGVDLLGPNATEEDLLAYACMISEEAYTSDETKRRGSESSSSSDTVALNDTTAARETPELPSAVTVLDPVDEELEPDVAEAIRRSLQEESLSQRALVSPESPPQPENAASSSLNHAESSTRQEDSDLELAVQLSLAEQESLGAANQSPGQNQEEFPALGSGSPSSSPSRRQKGRKGKEVMY